MKDIIEIVIHHSISQRDQTLEKSIASFDRSHGSRLHTEKNSLGYHIAYHYVIAGDGSYKQTRAHSEAGWHASNLIVNNRSIGICLTGNFDNEKPSKEQEKTLKTIVKSLKKQYDIEKISGHREYANKTCPGKNFTDDMLDYLLTMEDMEFKHNYYEIMKKEVPKEQWYFGDWDVAEFDKQMSAKFIIGLYRANK